MNTLALLTHLSPDYTPLAIAIPVVITLVLLCLSLRLTKTV